MIHGGQNLLVKNYESFGKGITPYILWACLNNQFCNADLKSITQYISAYNSVILNSATITEELASLAQSEANDVLVQSLKSKNINDSFIEVRNLLMTTGDALNKFSIDKKRYSFRAACAKPVFNQGILNVSEYLRTGEDIRISKWEYIKRRVAEAGKVYKIKTETTKLDDLYLRFEVHQTRIKEFIKANLVKSRKGELLIHKDIYKEYPKERIQAAFDVCTELKSEDYFLSKEVFSFFNGFSKSTSYSKLNKAVFTEFRNTIIYPLKPSDRRVYKREKDMYYLVRFLEW